MPEKLMTLQELSEYLCIGEEKIITLVQDRVIAAYQIGGELLRFRKEQIDAIRSEIEARVQETDRIDVGEARRKSQERVRTVGGESTAATFSDKLADFIYFNDFYIISVLLIIGLLVIIFRS